MKRSLAPIVLLLAAGCRGPEQFSAPAPAGAATCAIREAEQMGYRRLEGGEERGAVRVGRYIAPPPAREPTDPAVRLSDRQGPRLSDGPFESQLRISERDGSLRIAVLSEARNAGGAPDPGGPAGDARQILIRCMTQPAR